MLPRDPAPSAAMTTTPDELLSRLDAKHSDLLNRLDQLNGEIEQALAEIGERNARTDS